MAVDRTNTIQILHSPTAETNSPANAAAGGLTLAKGELAWQDQGTGGANGKLWIGDATAAGAVERHIGGVGTGAVAAAAAAGSLTGNTLAAGVTASSLTSLGTIGTLTATNYVVGGHTIDDIDITSESSDANDHLMTAAAIKARIDDLMVTGNSATTLATGTVNGTSYGITSDGGADDIVLAQADTDDAGLLSAAKWDEIVANTSKTGISSAQASAITANTAKNTNVSTDLAITGTTGARVITSSDGTDATIPIATTSVSGVMSKAIFDEHTANNAKVTNTDVNVSSANLKTALEAGFPLNAVTLGDSGDTVTIGNDLVITGDLTVSGDTITANVGTLTVEDKNIVLNHSGSDSSSTADGAGITIQDAVDASTDATILWTASSDTFTFSHAINANVTGNVTGDLIIGGHTVDDIDITSESSDANDHLMTAAAIKARIDDLMVTGNSATTLATGTVNGTSYGITSDGGADDIVLAQADTDDAGLLSAAKWDEIVANTSKTGISSAQASAITANTAKNTNVSTDLAITGTTGARVITSSDGTDATIPIATTSVSGVMSKAIFDEHTANNAKVTNSATTRGDLSIDTDDTVLFTGVTLGTLVLSDDSIVMTPSASDTITFAGSAGGALTITTVDDAAHAADVAWVIDGSMSWAADSGMDLSTAGVITNATLAGGTF